MTWWKYGRSHEASETQDVRIVRNDNYQTTIVVTGAESTASWVDSPYEDSRVGNNFDEESLGQSRKRLWHIQRALFFATLSSILLLIVVTLLSVGFSKGLFKVVPDSSGGSPGVYNNKTSSSERTQRLHEYLSTVVVNGAEGFNDPISPESRALAWMQFEDPLGLDPNEVEKHYRIDQRFALLTLWFQSDYDWFRQRSWLEGIECMWEGVKCVRDPLTGNAIVKELDLSQNNVQGSLPPNLHLLKNLTILNLSGNTIFGEIPPTMTSMIWLQELYLQNNFLSRGKSLDFSQMSNLMVVNLSDNNFDGTIPASLYNISSMKRIELNNNKFSGSISADIEYLTNLYAFTAAGNQLSGNISAISRNGNLTTLYLEDNDLTGQVSLEGISKLRELNLENNRFSGPLPDLSNSPNIQILRLGNNHFDNLFFPTNYLEMKNMINLGLNNLYLTGEIPASIGTLANLIVLNLEGNSLNGVFPLALTDLTNLRVLSVHNNELSGTIPVEISFLTSLEVLSLSSNQLQSVVPGAIRRLTSLKTLTLASNRLNGPILNAVAFMSELEVLDVADNAFTGVIPDFFWELTSLRILNLADNYFAGQLSGLVGNLKQLELLNTAANSFRGRIPQRITELTSLEVLDLSFNFLGGPIPTNIGDLSDLRELLLGTNFDESNDSFGLDGTIPASIANMQKLEKLEINRNRISGFLPSQHKLLQSIRVYDVSENENLGGTIPKDFSNMTKLNGLNIFGTNIDGGVPNGFCSRNVTVRVDCAGATSMTCSCCMCYQ